MGQEDIIIFLEKNKNKAFTPLEIAQSIGLSVGSVHSGLKALRKTNIIRYFPVKLNGRSRYAYYIGEVQDDEKDKKVEEIFNIG